MMFPEAREGERRADFSKINDLALNITKCKFYEIFACLNCTTGRLSLADSVAKLSPGSLRDWRRSLLFPLAIQVRR